MSHRIPAAQWDLFVATSHADLRIARACLQDGNIARLRTIFHRIKGAALMLGENDLAAASARGEDGCDDWSVSALAATLDLDAARLDVARAPQWEPSK